MVRHFGATGGKPIRTITWRGRNAATHEGAQAALATARHASPEHLGLAGVAEGCFSPGRETMYDLSMRRRRLVIAAMFGVSASACGGKTIAEPPGGAEGDSGAGRQVGPAAGLDASPADNQDAGVTCIASTPSSSGGFTTYEETCSDGHAYTVGVACAGPVLTCQGPSGSMTRIWPGGLCDANGNVLGDPFALCGFP